MPRWFPFFVSVTLYGILASPLVLSAPQLPYGCGTLENAYGPYDYTNPVHVRERLPIVERYHFTRDVETLRAGASTSRGPGGDLDYTLRAFPNHHRALFSMLQLFRMVKNDFGRIPGSKYPVHCWFERAVAFAPKDGVAHLMRGLYLSEVGQDEKADAAFQTAVSISPNSAEIHYNYGLVLADRKRYEEALREARRAYELGFPLPGLKNRLERAGVWREPDPAADDTE